MKLTDQVLLIAGGTAGPGLTDVYDCNVYALLGPQGYVLVDCGGGRNTRLFKESMAAQGLKPGDCRGILLTHAHADHAAGAAWLCAYTGAAAYALPQAARYTTQGDREAVCLDLAIQAGVYPADFAFPPCPVQAVEPGQMLHLAGLSIQVIDAPGHCSGHGVYLWQNVLFAGDCVFPGGRISLQPLWDCSLTQYAATMETLAELEFDLLLPSHHGYLLQNGKAPVCKARDVFRRLGVPENPATG